jgi:hypothetical protein
VRGHAEEEADAGEPKGSPLHVDALPFGTGKSNIDRKNSAGAKRLKTLERTAERLAGFGT